MKLEKSFVPVRVSMNFVGPQMLAQLTKILNY